MSQRVKKPGRPDESQGKRRRRRPTGSDADEDGTRSGSNSGGGNGSLSGGVWTPRNLGDLKVASIYNRNSAEAPAELYRKDLISAMKLPDSEPLLPEEYWLITDPWKQEWEKGVQVPVNPESLPESQVVVISPVADRSHDFRLPKKKYVRVTHDDFFNPDYHQLVSTAARAEKVCSYDLDDVDAAWLGCANSDRVMQILPVISEFLMEQVIEELELQCWEQVQTILKSQEGLGIEYDENVICDVCRSPESEEGNEMVFCDSCNICVHQACYGITSIPSGSFLCRTCTLGIRPSCILCPNTGGAMKATRSGHKWAHVACAIWIPEVSIGSVEKMEPITKISAIPQSRWSLICVICKEKGGACIQCSVKTCKTAYHVTCAFKNGLEMKPIIVDENAEDGIKLRSYCDKHSVSTKKDKAPHSGSEDDGEKKKSRAMTAEERNQARAEKYANAKLTGQETYAIYVDKMLQQIEAEFFKYVRLKDVSQNLAVDMDIVNLIYNYWKLKRKSLNNRPLVPPRPETTQLLTQQQEQDLEQMKMFVQLRQDLERVRNLCYMVSRREKLSRSYFRLREQAFQKQVALLTDKSLEGISGPERAAILDANHGPSIYDQVYSQNGTKINYKDFESLVTLISGGDTKPSLVNGIVKSKGSKIKANENPYKKAFVNGARRRSESLSSLSETDGVKGEGTGGGGVKAIRKPLAYLFDTDSSMDVVIMSNSTKTKPLPKKKVRNGKATVAPVPKVSTSDSELDLLPSPPVKGKGRGSISSAGSQRQQPIYSDTDSDHPAPAKVTPVPKKLSSASTHVVTKGALKEFSKKTKQNIPLQVPMTKSTIRVSPLLQKGDDPPAPAPAPIVKKRGRIPGRKKKVDPFEVTDSLIVPQREAAKKASESIRSSKKGKEQDGGAESPVPSSAAALAFAAIQSKEIKAEAAKEVEKGRRKSSIVDAKISSTKLGRRVTVPEVEMLPVVVPASAGKDKRASVIILSDGDSDGAGAVSIVPQRQAAKKAAEHIRSCQSNVVAARLIIEDEMEASRKKSKLERANSKGSVKPVIEKSPTRGRPPSTTTSAITQQARDLVSSDSVGGSDRRISVGKLPLKEKSPVKGNQLPRGSISKQSRKDSDVKSPIKDEPKNVDWPFLDKGSQSSCRRSRERSSSSSSTSSGSSSTTDSSSYTHSSSSSSRSSSPGSASPIRSNPKTTPPTPLNQSTLVPLSASGPGKKLKTSDRLPANRRVESPSKSPTKNIGPTKPGSRRGTATSLRAPSPEQQQQPIRNSQGRSSISPSKRFPTKSSEFTNNSITITPIPTEKTRSSPSVTEKRRSSTPIVDKTKSSEEKGQALDRDGKSGVEEEKVVTGSFSEKKTPPKTTPPIRDELALSSDSEEEGEVNSKEEEPIRTRGRSQSRSNSSAVTMVTEELKNRPMPKTKKRELGLLSEESSESADEKENDVTVLPQTSPAVAALVDSVSVVRKSAQNDTIVPVTPPPVAPPFVAEPPIALPPLSSPLAQLEDKGSEPEAKRPRLDTSPAQTHVTPSATLAPPPVLSIQVQSHTTVAPSMPKSIFSPIAPAITQVQGPASDLLDFDNDLYDLARSVTVDYGREAGECDPGRRESLSSFSFSQSLLGREDNKEESAQATINLVEKLRLQQKQKSGGTQRLNLDGSCDFDDITSEEPPPKSPQITVPSVSTIIVDLVSPVKSESYFPIHPNRTNQEEESEKVCDLSPTKVSPPENLKLMQLADEERWIQNNFHPIPTSSAQAQGHGIYSTKIDESNRFSLEIQSNLMPLHHQNFHSPQIQSHGQGHVNDDGTLGLMIPQAKESLERLMSHQAHHLGLLMEVPEGRQNNLISMATNSPTLPPGINLPPGLTATYSGTVPSTMPYTGTVPPPPPPPYQSAHQGFLPYPINSTLANVVTSLASGNLPFFHSQPPQLAASGNSKLSSLSSPPVSNAFSLGFAHHFTNLAPTVPPPHGADQTQGQGSMEPPSDVGTERRRTSSESNSLAVVTSGMPPLSKPPLTSPSLLLASNNAMAAPPPPPQSTVAQIIESVIQASNNHPINSILPPNNLHQLKGNFNDYQFRMNQFSKLLNTNSPTSNTSNLSSNNSPLVSPTLHTTMKPPPCSTSPLPTTVSDFSSILSNKTNDNILPQKMARDYLPVPMAPTVTVVSPKPSGRGRRPTTPKVKQDKATAEESSPKGKGPKTERKAASPGRGAKGSTTPRRGGGRGKGKGKNVVVRKDLAGTVYDIDLDEFEENTEDKFDLRSLRGRRKSNDINSGEFRKSESSEESPPPPPMPRLEKNSPRQKVTNCENDVASLGSRQRSASGVASTLLTPVDMSTYSVSHIDNNIDPFAQGGTVFQNSSAASEFASLIGAPSTATVNFDELDKTLEALSSPVKASPSVGPLQVNSSVQPAKSTSQHALAQHNSTVSSGGQGRQESSLSSSSFTTTFSEDNHSRNQLKVKIKGPFLDANYSSSNSSAQAVTYQRDSSSHLHHHLHQAEPMGSMNSTPMMNNPLNLRRMRKKELLRQYCNQDMNMDGRYTNPSALGGGEYMGHPHFHPYGRAVITIPKAVASMEIIPSAKDDYGLEASDLCPLPTPPPIPVQEKKKRNRGVNREMAALGLLEVPPKGERWRDPGAMSNPGFGETPHSRKRVRATAKPNRSTFVPPTLAESGGMDSGPNGNPGNGSNLAINHPTPKLKIKFGDLNSSATCTTSSGAGSSNLDSNHIGNLGDKDSKKAKGRPPKKRGISEVTVPVQLSMEELKRQSLMFREKIMKDFADDDRSKSSGKKKKKSKKSKRNDHEESNRNLESSHLKIITDGSVGKLILRIGKNRNNLTTTTISGTGNNAHSSSLNSSLNPTSHNNNNNVDMAAKNGPLENAEKSAVGEQDSGFTGSSEGSGGSWAPSTGSVKKFSSMSGVLKTNSSSPKPNHRKSEDNGGGPMLPSLQPGGGLKSGGEQQHHGGQGDSPIDSAVLKFKPTPADVVLPSTSNSVTPVTAVSPTLSKGPKDKVMPIRLKLHRCYEGYATTKEVDRENTNPKESDSCEVR